MQKDNIPEVEIYSDWWAVPNPWVWGYGVIMQYKWIKKEFYQWFKMTTNNRMELLWVITGLSKLKWKSKVHIFTDSQYTINWISKWWAKKWRDNNWFRTKSEKAVNYDLWEKLLDLTEKHEVEFTWVKWHNWHIENERCDELATLAMSWELFDDEWYLPEKIKPIKEKQQSFLENAWICKKCGGKLIKKFPKHTKKTLLKKYYYEYFYNCESCNSNFMLEEAKRDISTLKLK